MCVNAKHGGFGTTTVEVFGFLEGPIGQSGDSQTRKKQIIFYIRENRQKVFRFLKVLDGSMMKTSIGTKLRNQIINSEECNAMYS